jgi:hypothetical protein
MLDVSQKEFSAMTEPEQCSVFEGFVPLLQELLSSECKAITDRKLKPDGTPRVDVGVEITVEKRTRLYGYYNHPVIHVELDTSETDAEGFRVFSQAIGRIRDRGGMTFDRDPIRSGMANDGINTHSCRFEFRSIEEIKSFLQTFKSEELEVKENELAAKAAEDAMEEERTAIKNGCNSSAP